LRVTETVGGLYGVETKIDNLESEMDNKNKQATVTFLDNLKRGVEKGEISDFLVADEGQVAPGWRLIRIKFYDEVVAGHPRDNVCEFCGRSDCPDWNKSHS
jgi:hypothetical protein